MPVAWKTVKSPYDNGTISTLDWTPDTTNLGAYEQNLQSLAQQRALRQKYGFGTAADNKATSDLSGSGGTGGNSSSLFNNMGEYAGTFNSFADNALNRAKDWAQFQLGVNQQQGELDFGFRNREATRDFGFNTALTGQRIAGDQALESLRQTSETGRLEKSLDTQRSMQAADFANQTTQRAQQAALARLGFSR